MQNPAPRATPLFVHESGAGTLLLLIHGLMATGEMFQPVLPALAAHYHVIVPDLRGHGRSGALPGPYTEEQLAQDLVQLLDDLQIDAAHILGYSQGGAVAQQFVHDYPRRVRGLVLACTYACNMLSRCERLEGMLSPWLVRILGVRRMARLAINNGGGQRMSLETAHWLEGILAANLGVEYRVNLLPENKIQIVKDYQAREQTVVMVGDGVNDAPALAQSDIGIAMGAAGADIALTREDWALVPEVIRIARRTMGIVKMNLIFTAVYNIIGLMLAAFGILPPVLAAAAQSLPDIGILSNSARLLRQE